MVVEGASGGRGAAARETMVAVMRLQQRGHRGTRWLGRDGGIAAVVERSW